MGRLTVVATVSIATLVAGCASRAGRVTSMAANEFSCREYRIEIEELGNEQYRAAGCEQSALYQCTQTPNRPTEFSCERVLAPTAGPAPTPPAEPPPAAGPSREAIEASLRSGLIQRQDRILGCSEGQPLTVHAQYGGDGVVTFSLAGELSGSYAEQCIRDAFGPVRLETSGQAGTVSHTVQPETSSAPPPPPPPAETEEVPWEGD